MKKLFFIGLVMLLFMLGCQPRKTELTVPWKGAWKVVAWERYSADTLRSKLPGTYTGDEIKIWSDKYFLFSGRYKMDTVRFDNYGGGSFTYDGTHYVETILYWPKGYNIPAPIKLSLEMKGDTLIQTWPLDDKWQLDKPNRNIQTLIRLE